MAAEDENSSKAIKHRAPFGLDPHGWVRRADEVTSGRACLCICPECGWPLIAKHRRQSQITPHFAHAKPLGGETLPPCSGGLESGIHKMAKQILQEAKYLQLPPFTPELSQKDSIGRTHSVRGKTNHSMRFELTRIEVEEQIQISNGSSIRPDAIGIAEVEGAVKAKLLIETLFRHAVEQSKVDIAIVLDYSLLQIDLSNVGYEEMSSAEAFRRLVLDDVSNKHSLHRRVAPSVVEKLKAELGEKIDNANSEIEQARRRSEKMRARRLTRKQLAEQNQALRMRLADVIWGAANKLRLEYKSALDLIHYVDSYPLSSATSALPTDPFHLELFVPPRRFYLLRFGDSFQWQKTMLAAIEQLSAWSVLDMKSLKAACKSLPWPEPKLKELYHIRNKPPHNISRVEKDGWFFLKECERMALTSASNPFDDLVQHLQNLGVLEPRNDCLVKTVSLLHWGLARTRKRAEEEVKRNLRELEENEQLELARRSQYIDRANQYALWMTASEHEATQQLAKSFSKYQLLQCERCYLMSAGEQSSQCSYCGNKKRNLMPTPEGTLKKRHEFHFGIILAYLIANGDRSLLREPKAYLFNSIGFVQEALKSCND